jgi:hypothetical protein
MADTEFNDSDYDRSDEEEGYFENDDEEDVNNTNW